MRLGRWTSFNNMYAARISSVCGMKKDRYSTPVFLWAVHASICVGISTITDASAQKSVTLETLG